MIAKRLRLALEFTLALVAKTIALAIIWHVWFSDPEGQRTVRRARWRRSLLVLRDDPATGQCACATLTSSTYRGSSSP